MHGLSVLIVRAGAGKHRTVTRADEDPERRLSALEAIQRGKE